MDDPAARAHEMVGRMFDYASRKYGHEILHSYDECPYETDIDDDNLAYKEVLTWFVCERKNDARRTILDEFVDRFVDDDAVKGILLGMKSPIYDSFKVLTDLDESRRMLVESETNGRQFTIELGPISYPRMVGHTLTCRIHPWHDDGTYRVNGILKLSYSTKESDDAAPERDMMRGLYRLQKSLFGKEMERIESINISSNSKVGTLLKKLPAPWINTMCDRLELYPRGLKNEKIQDIAYTLTTKRSLEHVVSGLSEDEKTVLRFVLKKGGVVRHGDLCRRMGGDDLQDSHFDAMADERPSSPIGLLRCKGLLVVGRRWIGSRRYKVVAIPSDVAQHMML